MKNLMIISVVLSFIFINSCASNKLKKGEGVRDYALSISNNMNINFDAIAIKEIKDMSPEEFNRFIRVLKHFKGTYKQEIGNTEITVKAEIDRRDDADQKAEKKTDLDLKFEFDPSAL